MAKPDRRRMEHAVREFLAGAGLSLFDANLRSTPRRVVEAWASEFLDGYGKTAAEVLAERFPVGRKGERELVVVTQLHFRSMCPHHLLPYTGRAHVAYLPGKSVVGFGRLAALVDVFAHRLILQEELAQSVAKALVKHLVEPRGRLRDRGRAVRACACGAATSATPSPTPRPTRACCAKTERCAASCGSGSLSPRERVPRRGG